jgi:hypothetical protein
MTGRGVVDYDVCMSSWYHETQAGDEPDCLFSTFAVYSIFRFSLS